MHIAIPRSDLSNISAITAGAFEKGAEPIQPARNRRVSKAGNEPAPAAPALKAVVAMKVKKKIFRLP
jgi:hypothetical protein